MPKSQTAQELIAEGKLYYGDPCYDSLLGSTNDECKDATPGASLAHMVLDTYGIEVAEDWIQGPYAQKYSKCCPLDILNQDPLAVLKMSLMSSLLDEEYWEVYADEWGRARFIKVLPEDLAQEATLPRIQYCVPSFQPADIANLVVVKSADTPPFRKCAHDWYEVLDVAYNLRSLQTAGSFFPGGGSADDARGVMFTWGEVTGLESQGIDPTCEIGTFDQYGTIIYPDYERKQIYADGIDDVFEIGGFEKVLFWLVDIDYNVSEDISSHYSVQFVKSSDAPVQLGQIQVGDTWNGHMQDFGVVCDINQTGESSTGSDVNLTIYPDDASRQAAADKTCTSVQSSISSAIQRKNYLVRWQEFSIPLFFGYGYVKSLVNFNDYSKWSLLAVDDCVEEAVDNIYESTTALWGNGCPLDGWRYFSWEDSTYIDLGSQKTRRTLELPAGSVWVESGEDEGKIVYSLRAEAPYRATVKFGSQDWANPYANHMLTYMSSQSAGSASSNYLPSFNYPGYLFGWNEGLYTIDELWSKVKIARPGLSIQGFGRGVKSFLSSMSMKVKPVYQVDYPSATAAEGDNYSGCVDVLADLRRANQGYCKELIVGSTEAEKLQEAMTGNTITLTLPFLFPDFKGKKSSEVVDDSAYQEMCDLCHKVAVFLWTYIEKYKDEANKGYTYICGPPTTQQEVPRLGEVITTPHGKRTINSIAYSYNDESAFTVNIDTGPVSLSSATTGTLTKKKTTTENLKGRIVDQIMGALYKVDIPGLGIIQAWNSDRFPWDIGDKVNVTLYNHPLEL